MKVKLYFAAFAAMAFAACNELVVCETEEVSDCVELNLSVPLSDTKSVGTEDESRVGNFQVYIFDSAGGLEAYGNVRQKNSTTLQCKPGTKQIVAIVNAPDMNDIKSYQELKDKTSYMKDNTWGQFIMTGELTEDVDASADITIPVKRILGKITVTSITNAMALEYHKTMRFEVTNIFLINVPGTTGYLDEKTPELWYSERKISQSSSEVHLLVNRTKSDNIKVPYGETVAVGETYYSYPNSTETDSSSEGDWTPRYTRLVVEAWLGSDKYYYPISVPGLERNTAYEIKLTVTGPGSKSPDVPVVFANAPFTISIDEWIDKGTINEKI